MDIGEQDGKISYDELKQWAAQNNIFGDLTPKGIVSMIEILRVSSSVLNYKC